MNTIKRIAKQIPGLHPAYRIVKDKYALHRRKKSGVPERVFTEIYEGNEWNGEESVSGTGSDHYQTRIVSRELPKLMADLGVETMLDVPCGDFHWMKDVDLSGVDYTGGDIVKDLIRVNNEKHGREGVRFQHLNLIGNKIPRVDLVFCRDCLVHLCFADILLAFENICKSRSSYLLTTVFTDRDRNNDITTGQWHGLNMELPPFEFPKPMRMILEGCTEGDGAYQDKGLALWRIDDLRKCLSPMRRSIRNWQEIAESSPLV